jgi:hypothetical protein
VVASDGLTQTVATSGGFTIEPQPPRAVILNPTEGGTALESQAVTLYGQGVDSQQGILTDTHQLTWISDRDGTLGTGSQVDVLLSIGTHTITLQAENSAGLTATTQITLTVLGDYDGDGVPDTIESSSGLNPLTSVDALSDADGDGLINIVEQTYGTDSTNPDSDGDGRSDGEEVAQGTDPLAMDTPTPDQLTVSPATLVFTADLSIDTTLPQRWVQVLSGVPATWTVTSSAAWLHVFPLSGITPAPQTVMVDPSVVGEGTYTAMLTYSSTELGSSVTLPITVTVINKASYCDANRDGVTDQQDTATVQAHVGAAYGQPAYRQQYDLNRDGVINTQDVLLASVCISQGEVKRVFLPLVRR